MFNKFVNEVKAAVGNCEIKAMTKNKPDISVDFIKDFKAVKPMLKAQLYHETKANKEWATISASAWGFNDLLIVPTISLEIGGGSGNIKLTHEIINNWGVSLSDVISIALSNISGDYYIKSLTDILGLPDMESNMFVVSNTNNCFGAIAIIAALEELKEKFKDGFLVIPSSLHEVIAIDKSSSDNFVINQMINEVNASTVADVDILSNHCYEF